MNEKGLSEVLKAQTHAGLGLKGQTHLDAKEEIKLNVFPWQTEPNN